MPRSDRAPVLAIGMDAAQGTYVRELIDDGELPALAALLERGSWSKVNSPAYIGSGTVWPTFASASHPWEHGYQSEWSWHPDQMRVVRTMRRFEPFWRSLDKEGLSVGVVDVPFLEPAPLSHGFELSEWGSHERAYGQISSSPPELAEQVLREPGGHPYTSEPPQDPEGMSAGRLSRVAEASRRGIRMRGELGRRLLREHEPDLLVLVFSELHHSGHVLWHTVEPENPVYTGKPLADAQPRMRELYKEMDAQVAALADAAGDGARVVVFSLHGMRPGYGIPDFVADSFEHYGIGRRVDLRSGPVGARARSAFGALKRRAPTRVRRLYRQFAPQSVSLAVAAPTMVAAWDWQRTRAFTLNSDQHSWVRLNVKGREREGIVPPAAYDETCREAEEMLRSLKDEAGNPLITEVVGLAERAGGPPHHLPDLVARWTPEAYADPVRIAGTPITSTPTARRLSGRHDLDGFCISAGNGALGDEIDSTELHRLLRP
ncbi:MAG TPA: alkaline phosphatase family protein [Thermoleophilaceae bacterium]|jgi:predicted AlkP superfamily phosphohydrolase/phosphomutase